MKSKAKCGIVDSRLIGDLAMIIGLRMKFANRMLELNYDWSLR